MRIITIFTILLFPGFIFSQQYDLHIPKEIKKAYSNNTRSITGSPGQEYWHNTADYDIEVAVDPETRNIEGSETIKYFNNSPDELTSLVVRLYYDVFKKGAERGMSVKPEDISEGVEISKLEVAGQPYDLNNPNMVRRGGTNLIIMLSQPLAPENNIELEFEWKQKVPLTVRRTGAKDSTSFFIAYWYPQMAVYDDIFGWDMLSYTFDTEFYNNLGNYSVEITAPENFVVWSTGVLQNANDVMPEKYLSRYRAAKLSEEPVMIVDSTDLDDLNFKSGSWHFKADEVSDFAFAMSDHYMWEAVNQEVDGRKVLISSAFPREEASRYTELTGIQKKTMKHFSEDIPGVPYPYPAFSTFIGLNGGGMEFPMMANNAGPGRGVTIHELYHTYFPMYVRTNERRWAWMDEGWADFITSLVTHKYFSDEESNRSFLSNFKLGMQGTAGSIGDLPTVTSSQYMGNNYGYHSYTLPGFTYALIYNYLGEEVFLNCYKEYINRWAKKSPTPYDFFYTFEDVSGEDLNWLWEPWYFGFGNVDLSLGKLSKGKLSIENKGRRPVPVILEITYNDGTVKNIERSAKIISESKSITVTIPDSKKVKKIALNNDVVDENQLDNFYPPLSEIYENFDLNRNVLGEYQIEQYPISAIVEESDGIYKLTLTRTGIESYIMPESGSEFNSLDKNINITFEEGEDDQITGIEVSIKAFGITISGKKK